MQNDVSRGKSSLDLVRMRQKAETYNFCLVTMRDDPIAGLDRITRLTKAAWADVDKYCMDDMGNAIDRAEECHLEEAREDALEARREGRIAC